MFGGGNGTVFGGSTRFFGVSGRLAGSADNGIQYTIYSHQGNGADFGDTSVTRWNFAATANETRGMIYGGETPSASDVVDYVTMATIGNATDFGNLSAARHTFGALASSTRAVTGGGYESDNVDTMDYFTIGSTGNATDFGNLVAAANGKFQGPSCSTTRGLFAGGAPGYSNV